MKLIDVIAHELLLLPAASSTKLIVCKQGGWQPLTTEPASMDWIAISLSVALSEAREFYSIVQMAGCSMSMMTCRQIR